LEYLTDAGKLKLLEENLVWIVHIFINGTVSKEELLYYGLAKQAEPNQIIESGFWIAEGVTVHKSGDCCYVFSGVVNQSGGDYDANSGAVVN